MIDHLGIEVSDYAAAKAFYEQALAPLGYAMTMEPAPGTVGGFGPPGGVPFFWISTRGKPQTGLHIAFSAADRATVDAFHTAAIEAGATDNGEPGVREIYHPNYYGAFVNDLDGNNVEAVCHRPA